MPLTGAPVESERKRDRQIERGAEGEREREKERERERNRQRQREGGAQRERESGVPRGGGVLPAPHRRSGLHPTPYTLHPTLYTLHSTPYTPHLAPCPSPAFRSTPLILNPGEREFSIDNLLVRIPLIAEMIYQTGPAPWEFEFPFPGSLVSAFLEVKAGILPASIGAMLPTFPAEGAFSVPLSGAPV